MVLFLACITAVGCAHNPPEYRARVRVDSAQLVAVNPDVKTVADADEPLFFSGGYFWLFHDGGWWRGERATSERWTYVANPPVPVKQIQNPFAFTNYRDVTETQTAARETKAAPVLQQSLVQPTKVDHRTEAAPAERPAQPATSDAAPAATTSPTTRSSDPWDPASTESRL